MGKPRVSLGAAKHTSRLAALTEHLSAILIPPTSKSKKLAPRAGVDGGADRCSAEGNTAQCSAVLYCTVLYCTVLGCCCPSLRPFLCSFRSLNIGRDHLDERWRLALRATRHLQMPSRRTRLSKPKRARPCEVLKEIRHLGCCAHGQNIFNQLLYV